MNPLLVAVDEVLVALVGYLDGRSPKTFTALVEANKRLSNVRQQIAASEQ